MTPIKPSASWRDLVKAWGDRALTVIELEERIATLRRKLPLRIPDSPAARGDRPGEG